MARVMVATLVVLGCVHQPQTSDAFRQAVQKGSTFTRVRSMVVERPFAQVVSALQARVSSCLAVETRSTTLGSAPGDMSSSVTRYHPNLQVGDERAELTLQAMYSPKPVGSQMPPDGFFLMVADIIAEAGKTRITIYGRSVGKDSDLAEALPAWASGSAPSCPLE
jgi:hypothetical protein